MSDEKKLYRNIQKKMRVTPEENELIKRRMSKHHFKNFNTYARYMLLTGEVITVDYSELIKLRTEINRTNEVVSLENFQTIQAALTEVKRLMDENFSREITQIEKILKERRE